MSVWWVPRVSGPSPGASGRSCEYSPWHPAATPAAGPSAGCRGSPTAARGRCARHRRRPLRRGRQVAVHPVGRADVELAVERVVRGRREVEDPRVLEEPADDRTNADVLAEPGDARPEPAEPADDQVDRHAGARRLVQRRDRSSRPPAGSSSRRCAPAGPRALCSASRAISSRNRGRMVAGATSSFWKSRGSRAAGQVVEQLDEVGGDRRVAGEQADVGVEPGGSHVVVAGADVGVAADARRLPWRTTSAVFVCVFRLATPTVTCTPARSSSAAEWRLRSSSNRALSSMTQATCLPASAARISERTNGVSSPMRYSVILIATVCGRRRRC